MASSLRSAAVTVPQAFLAPLAVRDWDRLARCFSPNVLFRALTPPALREAASPQEVAAWFSHWWDAADQFEVMESEITPVADRVRIRYRVRMHEDAWVIVEQQAYCEIGARGIEMMDLVCTGDRPA
jgi:SnoaL-like protein